MAASSSRSAATAAEAERAIALGMGRGPELRLELGVLADARSGGSNLIGLVAKQLDAARELVRIGQELGGGSDAGAPGSVRLGDVRNELAMATEAVHQAQLTRWLEEPLLLVLAVDLRETSAKPSQPADGHRPVVGPHERAPVGPDLAPHDERPVPRGHHLGHRIVVRGSRSVEDRLHASGIGPGADLVGRGAGAERERERVDDQRLARPGLAGQHREAGSERQADRLDHGEVLDGQLAEGHGVSIGLSRAAATPSCAAGRRTVCCRWAG